MGCSKIRLYIAILGTLCPMVCYISRVNLSIAIVAMVGEPEPTLGGSNSTHNATDSDSGSFCSIPDNAGDGPKKENYGPKYNWTSQETGYLTGSFFWTYTLAQIPLARCAEIVGAKWIMGGAGIGSALFSLLSPLAADVNLYAFMLTRAAMGAFQAAIYPAGYILYAQWLPPTERSIGLTVLGMGAFIGSIISSSVSGYLCEQESMGWPWVFYLSGAVCSVWALIWVLFASSHPRAHKCITLQELDYIASRMDTSVKKTGTVSKVLSWRKMLKSKAVWSLIATFTSATWAFSVIILLLPQYFNFALRIPAFKNGIINSIIYVIYCIASPIVGSVSTWLIQRQPFGISPLIVRKLFEGIAVFGSGACFAIIPMLGCDQTMVIGVLFTQIAFYSFINGGDVQVPSELSPDFSGTLYAMANTFGSSAGTLAPAIHGWIVTDRNDLAQWNIFFYLSAALTMIGGIVFIVWGRNDLHDFTYDDTQVKMEPKTQVNAIVMTDFRASHTEKEIKQPKYVMTA
ncbi:Sialin [Fragariocoptes setiger]|uniref:Sialin n=1 Tax=Fragariocoptes setiger TaxID=1670756 RepID=A0ABQ7S4U8_9ACAR|nr:Sialin [Fragariocoptes setiger]